VLHHQLECFLEQLQELCRATAIEVSPLMPRQERPLAIDPDACLGEVSIGRGKMPTFHHGAEAGANSERSVTWQK
jgi:hypothetical protein